MNRSNVDYTGDGVDDGDELHRLLDRENGLQEEEEVEEGENGAGGGAVPAQRRRFWDVFF